MRVSVARYLLLVSVALLGVVPARAGNELIVIEKVQVVRTISGVVRDRSGSPIEGATVAEVSADHETVIRSVVTGEDGSFRFPQEPKQQIYDLMISAHNFNPLLVHVRTSRWTRRALNLRLEVAT